MKEKKEKATPIRKVIYLMVVLSKGRVYKIPIEGTHELEIRKLPDFNTLQRILTPLIHIYYNVCVGTKLEYEDFGAFLMDLEHLGYEVFEEEKKKQGPGSSFMESQKSSIIKEAIYLLTPQLP